MVCHRWRWFSLFLNHWNMLKPRGANILAEVVGYAANSDGADMVAPSGEVRLAVSSWH